MRLKKAINFKPILLSEETGDFRDMFKFLNPKAKTILQPLKTSIRIIVSGVHNRPISNRNPLSNPAIDFILNEVAPEFEPSKPSSSSSAVHRKPQEYVVKKNPEAEVLSGVIVSHPWPEWVELMEKLIKGGYFDGIGHPFDRAEMAYKDVNLIRTACLNFARRQPDLIR